MASPEILPVSERETFDEPVDTSGIEGQEVVETYDYREVTNVRAIPTKIDDGHEVDEHGTRPGSACSGLSMAQTDADTQEVIKKCAIRVKSESESHAEYVELPETTIITRPSSGGLEVNSGFHWAQAKQLQTIWAGNQQGCVLPQQLATPTATEAPETSVPTTEPEPKPKDTEPQMLRNISGQPDVGQMFSKFANQKRKKGSVGKRRAPQIPPSVATQPLVSNEQCDDVTPVLPSVPPLPEDPATEEQPIREHETSLHRISSRLSSPRVMKSPAKKPHPRTARSEGHEVESREERDFIQVISGYTSVTLHKVVQEIRRLQSEKAELETLHEQSMASKQVIGEQLQAAVREKNECLAALEQKQSESVECKKQLTNLKNFATGLGNDSDDLRERHSRFEDKFAQKTKEMESTLEKLNLRCEGLQGTLNDKKRLLTETDNRVTQLEQALASADSRNTQAIHEGRSRCEDLERQVNDKDTLLIKEREQSTRMEQELVSLRSSNIEALQKDFTDLRDEVQAIHSAWKSAQASGSSSRPVEDVLADVKAAMGRTQEEIEQAATDRANVVALQERLTLSDGHVRDADSRILTAQEKEQELHTKIATLQARLDLQEKSNTGQVAEGRLDEARAELDATKSALEQSQSQLTSVRNELQELTISRSTLQQQVQTLQRDLGEAQGKVVELGNKLPLADKQTEDYVAEVRKKLNDDIKIYESELKTKAENEVQQIKNERNRFSKEARSLQLQLKEMQSLQQQFSSCKTRCDELSQERDTAENSAAELREENENAKQQIATLEDDLTTAHAELRTGQEEHESFLARVEQAWEAEQERFARESVHRRRNLQEAMETSSTWFEQDRAAQAETPLEQQGDFAPSNTTKIGRLEAPSLEELHSSGGLRSAGASGNTEGRSPSAIEYRVRVSTVDDSQITLGSFFAAAESARRTSSHHTRSDNAEMLIEADDLSQPLSETLRDLPAGVTPQRSRNSSQDMAGQQRQATGQVSRSLHSSSHSSSPAFVDATSARKMSTYHGQGDSERHRSSTANEGRSLDPRIANRSTPTSSKRKADFHGEKENKRLMSSSRTRGFESNSTSGKGRSDASSPEAQPKVPATSAKKPGSRTQSSASTKQSRMRNLAGGNVGGGSRRVTRRASKEAEMGALFAHELKDNRGR